MRRREGDPHVLDRPPRHHRPYAPRVSLLGRDEALERLLQVVARERLATLTGPGGIGKTTLARSALDRLRADDREAWFVDAVHVDRAADLVSAIVAAIELAPGPWARRRRWTTTSPGASHGSSSTTSRTSLPTAWRQCSTPASRCAPGLHVLATSRVPIGRPARCRSASRDRPPCRRSPGHRRGVCRRCPVPAAGAGDRAAARPRRRVRPRARRDPAPARRDAPRHRARGRPHAGARACRPPSSP